MRGQGFVVTHARGIGVRGAHLSNTAKGGAAPVGDGTKLGQPPNLLTGGLDEYFTRTDASGTSNFLTDALGSAAELSDMAGTNQTQYSYDPFGNNSQSGASTTSSFGYTSRENDGSGLYYYRARYYNPQLGRFISEDPAGLKAGINFYAYSLNNPVNFRDPLGL